MNILETLTIKILEAGLIKVGKHWSNAPEHIPPFCRLYWIFEGDTEILYNREKVCLRKGSVYLFPEGRPTKLIEPSSELIHLYMHINASVLGGLSIFRQIETPIVVNSEVILPLLPENWKKVITDSVHSDSEKDKLHANALMQIILLSFIPFTIENDKQKLEKQARFESILSYINTNFSKPISIQKLAKRMHLQSTYFSNLFSETIGISPRQYICQIRVNHAQQRLISSELSIKEIALECGYEDEFYFSRLFKSYIGISPKVYRNQRRTMVYHS